MTDRLYRSATDRVIAGVAGGLATWLNLDPSLVRVGWVILAILSGGIFVLIYIAMMIIVPLAPPGWQPTRPSAPPGGSPGPWTQPPAGSTPGWTPPPGAAPAAGSGWTPPPGTAWTTPSPHGDPWSWGHRERTNAGIVIGVVLVVLGVWFLIDQYVDIDWHLLWPVVVIGVGVALIVGALQRNRPPG